MRRALTPLTAGALLALGACSGDSQPEPRLPERSVPPSAARVVPLGDMRAASEALQRILTRKGRDGLPELTGHHDPEVALHAAWELAKGDRGRTSTFVRFLARHSGAEPPEWWAKCLAGVTVYEGNCHYFPGIDRRPLRELPENERGEHDLRHAHGNFEFRAGPSDAGSPFPLRAFDHRGGQALWEAEVWAAGRMVLAGQGAHRVELAATSDRVVVFGAESHGAYAEAFDLADGRPLLRFCTCYWFNFPEEWDWAPK